MVKTFSIQQPENGYPQNLRPPNDIRELNNDDQDIATLHTLNELARKRAREMGTDEVSVVIDRTVVGGDPLTRGIHYDTSDHTIHANANFMRQFTKQEQEMILTHELQHSRQSASMDSHQAELDADAAMVEKYGVEATIKLLDKLARVAGVDPNVAYDREHGSIRERQEAIRQYAKTHHVKKGLGDEGELAENDHDNHAVPSVVSDRSYHGALKTQFPVGAEVTNAAQLLQPTDGPGHFLEGAKTSAEHLNLLSVTISSSKSFGFRVSNPVVVQPLSSPTKTNAADAGKIIPVKASPVGLRV